MAVSFNLPVLKILHSVRDNKHEPRVENVDKLRAFL